MITDKQLDEYAELMKDAVAPGKSQSQRQEEFAAVSALMVFELLKELRDMRKELTEVKEIAERNDRTPKKKLVTSVDRGGP